MAGKVKWYNPVRGYGVIERNNKSKDEVFVYYNAIKGSNFKRLNRGESVMFRMEKRKGKMNAVNVTVRAPILCNLLSALSAPPFPLCLHFVNANAL